MPKLNNHQALIRGLIEEHTNRIHGKTRIEQAHQKIRDDKAEPLKQPSDAQQSNVSTLPHRKP